MPGWSHFAGFSTAQDEINFDEGINRTESGKRRETMQSREAPIEKKHTGAGNTRMDNRGHHPPHRCRHHHHQHQHLPAPTSAYPKRVLPSPAMTSTRPHTINTNINITNRSIVNMSAPRRKPHGWATPLPGAGHVRNTTNDTINNNDDDDDDSNNNNNQEGQPTQAKQETTNSDDLYAKKQFKYSNN